jgi:glycyl-tRNA synthetase beta chain
MPEFFLELFGEEIPARMQQRGAADLARLVMEALAPLRPVEAGSFYGPRRIALALTVEASVAESRSSERGPRVSAPEQALAGFLRKHAASPEALRQEGEFWVLDKLTPGVDAASLIAGVMPGLLRRFPWPKSMRWGGTSLFTWVRPLRRIVAVLDGAIVPFDLRDGADDGHGLASGNLSEGHRFLSPGAFEVRSCAQWQSELRARHVIPDAGERRAAITAGIARLAAARQLSVVADPGLVDEVAGLVEWPVPLLGRIDDAYMSLPAEVMQVSMRVNQRYFALRDAEGRAAPWFAFVANIAAADGGATIVAGNERVLRARFSDARHFWDLDRTRTLDSRVAALDAVTFHAKLGSQGARVARLERLAAHIAPLVGADPAQAARAARLAKADLTTGMVAEFPELQGVMGGYYARHDGEPDAVADAVRDHYAPKGPSDPIPTGPVSIAVALADKLDVLAGFFAIGEKPTGSGDPYALRRAALGVIRIIRDHRLRLALRALLAVAGETQPAPLHVEDLLAFLAERLRVQLRAEGARHDVLSAVLTLGLDDDFVRILDRANSIVDLLDTQDGSFLIAATRRVNNILRIAEQKDETSYSGQVQPSYFGNPVEGQLNDKITEVEHDILLNVENGQFQQANSALTSLIAPIDAFFDAVTINLQDPNVRSNRLALLSRVRATTNLVADFSKIEG